MATGELIAAEGLGTAEPFGLNLIVVWHLGHLNAVAEEPLGNRIVTAHLGHFTTDAPAAGLFFATGFVFTFELLFVEAACVACPAAIFITCLHLGQRIDLPITASVIFSF